MSATLGTLLREVEPNLSMVIYERLSEVAQESSGALNNAGTGHAGYCELNYTPENKDGSIETKKAVEINESFELSKQFWAYLISQKRISNSQTFINPIPHMSFVTGDENVAYLRKRYQALQKHLQFQEMKFSEDPGQIEKWIPLTMEGRDRSKPVAATWTQSGTDVNFGNLSAASGYTTDQWQNVSSLRSVPHFFDKISERGILAGFTSCIKRNQYLSHDSNGP